VFCAYSRVCPSSVKKQGDFWQYFLWKKMRLMRPEVGCSVLVIQPTKPAAVQDAAGATAVFCHHMEHHTEGPAFGSHLYTLTQQISLAANKSKINKIIIFTILRAGRPGDRITEGGGGSRTCPDRPWGPSSLLHDMYRVIPERKAAGKLTNHPYLAPRLR